MFTSPVALSVMYGQLVVKTQGRVLAKRVKIFVTVEGKVSVLSVTDKQYGDIVNFWGKKEKNKKAISGPVQLEIIW